MNRPILLLLVGISAVGPLALNGVLPATSAVMAELATSYGVAQMVLTIYLFATLVSQLVLGPAADRHGRRPVMVFALVVFTLGSIGCALAPSIEVLLGARFVQGFGGAVCMFLPRTIVRDVHPRDRAASVIGYMTTAMMIAPMFGPAIGGWATDTTSWRWMYGGLAVLGTVMATLAWRFQPETLPPAEIEDDGTEGDEGIAAEEVSTDKVSAEATGRDVTVVPEVGATARVVVPVEAARRDGAVDAGRGNAETTGAARADARHDDVTGPNDVSSGAVGPDVAGKGDGTRTDGDGPATREGADDPVAILSGRPPLRERLEARLFHSPFGVLGRERAFVAYALLMTGSVGVYYSFLAGGPYVAMESRGLDASTFGRWFAMIAVGYLTGNLIAGRFSERVGVSRMIVYGLVPFFTGVALFWALAGWSHPLGLFLPMQLVALSNGMSLPNMISGAMSVRPALAASASGIAGGLQTAFGVCLTLAVGLLLPLGDIWLEVLVTLCAVITVTGLLVGRGATGTPGDTLARAAGAVT